MDRILVIAPRVKGELSYRDKVTAKYKISNEELDRLIDTGDAIMFNNKQICFDIPILEAYQDA